MFDRIRAAIAAGVLFAIPACSPRFQDEAPANRQVATADVPIAFVDHNGTPVDLSQYRGKQNVVLVVVRGLPESLRGDFCPYCLAQTGSLMANYGEFQKRGAEVVVVFPGPADRVADFVSRARGPEASNQPVPFPLLLDKDCSACDKLAIRDDLAKPSTFILDKRGNVVYAYVGKNNTSDRPSVAALLAELDRIAARP